MILLARAATVLKYLLAGALVWICGALFVGSSAGFQLRSTPGELIVVDVESRRDRDGYVIYRPVFARTAEAVPRREYAGNTWSRTPPHARGDIVAGRWDPATGEMRSDAMTGKTGWLGRLAQVLGILVALQAIPLLFGFPEELLPLRVRGGARRRRFAIRL